MMEEYGQDRLRLMIVLGEKPDRGPADARYCRQYASTYADDASHFYVDHDGTRAFPQLFGYLNVYTDDRGQFGLPWNALLSADDPMIYKYADRSGSPGRLGDMIEAETGGLPMGAMPDPDMPGQGGDEEGGDGDGQ
jgi:hypothetical protein